MKIDTYITIRSQKPLSLVNFYIILILFLSNFHSNYCQDSLIGELQPISIDPRSIISLQNETYFNSIIKFDKKRYQVGRFATNKNGDLILELYENTETTSTRLFYGLTKEGRYLFSDEPSYTHEKIVESSSNPQRVIDLNGKSNSFNLFVSIENKEYLLAFNSYSTWIEAEFYDLNNEYHKWNFNNLFGYAGDINNFEFTLLELKSNSTYFIVSIPKFYITKETNIGNKFIKKFNFKTFNDKPYNEINMKGFEDFLNSKIINVFLMDACEILVVFLC